MARSVTLRQRRCEADLESFSRKKDQEAGQHSLLEADQGREPRRSKNHDDGIAQQKDYESRERRAHGSTLAQDPINPSRNDEAS